MTINKYTFEVQPLRYNIHVDSSIPKDKVEKLALRALYKKEVIGIEDIECIAMESYEESDDIMVGSPV